MPFVFFGFFFSTQPHLCRPCVQIKAFAFGLRKPWGWGLSIPAMNAKASTVHRGYDVWGARQIVGMYNPVLNNVAEYQLINNVFSLKKWDSMQTITKLDLRPLKFRCKENLSTSTMGEKTRTQVPKRFNMLIYNQDLKSGNKYP